MADISEWSTKEEENTHLDELTLSGEGGLYTNKIMCAVKEKMDEVDGKLAKVQGAYVFKGTKADMTALEAVTDPSVGDVYSVTALGGENYAWDGTGWDSLGTSDANVVHKTGDEVVGGKKSFASEETVFSNSGTTVVKIKRTDHTSGQAESTTYVGSLLFVDSQDNNLSLLRTGENASHDVFVVLGATNSSNNSCTAYLYSKSDDTNIIQTNANIWPRTTDVQDIGTGDKRFQNLYLSSGAISTSDARLKSEVGAYSDDVLDAWGEVEFIHFKFNKAVAEKGNDARIHSGLVAQQIKDKFEEHGLDITKYGLFCHDSWAASEAVVDEKNQVVLDGNQSGDVYSIRYEEALSLEAAFQRRRADRLEARIAALEERLNGN